jgi:hypothetical protein
MITRGADGESAPSADSAETDAAEESIEETAAVVPAEPVAAPVHVAPRNFEMEAPRQLEPAAPPATAIAASVVLPVALPAPMPVEQLKAMLELAGLSLVQTEADKLHEAEPGCRASRSRHTCRASGGAAAADTVR